MVRLLPAKIEKLKSKTASCDKKAEVFDFVYYLFENHHKPHVVWKTANQKEIFGMPRYGFDNIFASETKTATLMKNMVYCLICNLLLVALVILTSCGRQSDTVAIVPAPVCVVQEGGCYVIGENTAISVDDGSQMPVAQWFSGLFETPAGFVLEVSEDDPDAEICFISDSTMMAESYRLYVDKDGIDIYASGPSGFFYALQTVRMALPAQIESDVPSPDVEWKVPSVTVYDAPRFEYRGLMVDVSRYFLPKADLLEIIDCMAMLKLNNLHLHLTDDNGWRVEIKKYPLLTQVGAWRADRGDTPFPDRHNPVKGEPTPVGGYYTQDDIREIVEYASRRHINIIPEIDMPAHSNSALAAYPQFACPVVDKYIGVLPGLGGPNADIIYCAGNDEVFEFLKDIIDEICELFPSKYIHLGGDEAWKTYWEICPRCQARMRTENLVDEEALQGWFMARMNDYLMSKGRTMMGWDEVTHSRIPEGTVVYGWRGKGDAALKAAQRGHDFILTPSELLYLIRYQGPQWFEPLTYFGNSTLRDVFEYEPVGEDWPVEYQQRLRGIQGSMWTEFCDNPDDVTYQIFPRLAAVAEVAWSPAKTKDWEDFLVRADVFGRHLDEKGVVYSKAMYNIQHKVVPTETGKLSVNLECERPDVSVRYTLDGTVPEALSAEYAGNLIIDRPTMVKAATFFSDGTRAGKILELPVGFNKATACTVLSGRPSADLLVNGVQGSLRQTDFEWCHFHDDASFIVDLREVTEIDEVTIGALTNYGMAFNRPSSISVALSEDGVSFSPVSSRIWTSEEIFCQGNFREDVRFSFLPRKARYVKVTASHPGVCPKGHIREGQLSKCCFDELAVYGPSAKVAEDFLLCRKPRNLYGERKSMIQFSGSSEKDTSKGRPAMTDKSQKDLIRWTVAGGM